MRIIIFVKDSNAEKALFTELSAIGHELELAQSKDEVFQLLEASTKPAVIFLYSDSDLCAKIKQSNHCEHYVIMLIDESSPEQIVASMKAKADDCLGMAVLTSEEISAHIKLAELALKIKKSSSFAPLKSLDQELEKRYRIFIRETEEPIWLVEFKQPCDISLSEEEQITHFTLHGYMADCSDTMAQNCGFARVTELVGKRLKELFFFDCPVSSQTLRQFISSGYKLTDVETKRIDADGKERSYLNSLIGIVENGSLSCIWGTRREITKQKRLEAQLQKAQKMEALGRLVGGVAHDFNNLLTAIAGYGDLISQNSTEQSPFYATLKEMRKATERACMLTKQLLSFSGKQGASIEVVNLNILVAEFSQLLQHLIGEDICIKLSFDLEPSCIKADPTQIEQLLLNFAVNARSAMQRGGDLQIAVRNVDLNKDLISARGIVLAGKYVLLSVRDTGCGMSDTTMAQIFEPFFTTKDDWRGTGLGLATVSELVEKQNGFITVTSRLDVGTTFNVYLPRDVQTLDKELEPKEQTDMKQEQETVLLVEDEDAVRQAISEILEINGYKVLKASNGNEALEISRAHSSQIDLLLTDVIMPQMNGRQLADTMLSQRPETEVMFMSGYTDDIVVKYGALNEEVAFIQKPFALNIFIKKIREVLDKKERVTRELAFKVNSAALPVAS